MRRLILAFAFVFFSISPALADYHFPALTGRVVDDAHVLSAATRENLEQTLADVEQKSGTQIVVATVPSLEGGAIEDYGYQLGRFWGIGQKGKNNGVILLVAPTDRKVRIEVGYGLEATLTDTLCNSIIQEVILPNFRAGKMEMGVVDGISAIIEALGGHSFSASTENVRNSFSTPIPTLDAPTLQLQPKSLLNLPRELVEILFCLGLLLLLMFLTLIFTCIEDFGGHDHRTGRSGSTGGFGNDYWSNFWSLIIFIFSILGRSGGSSSGSGGGGFSGGFSGGGGSFGGGGASGGW